MTGREPAWRVLANEFSSALEEERGSGERAASYLLTPLGARMNRVLMVGSLGVAESVGRDDSQPFLRARLTDPTGSTFVTAGGFQPRAMSQLKAGGAPRLPLEVGKAHLYHGRDGVAYGSVRAEAVRTLSDWEYRAALSEVTRQTLDRLDLLEELRSRSPDATAKVASENSPGVWVRGAQDALRRYPTVDRAPFRSALSSVVEAIAGSPTERTEGETPRPPLRVTRILPPPPKRLPTSAERALDAAFLEVLDELAENSVDGYADLKELLDRVGVRGISKDAAETLLDRLEEEGAVEEPIVGKLRRS